MSRAQLMKVYLILLIYKLDIWYLRVLNILLQYHYQFYLWSFFLQFLNNKFYIYNQKFHCAFWLLHKDICQSLYWELSHHISYKNQEYQFHLLRSLFYGVKVVTALSIIMNYFNFNWFRYKLYFSKICGTIFSKSLNMIEE